MIPVRTILWGGLAAGLLLLWSWGSAWLGDYRELVEQLAAVRREKSLDDGRIASYRRMIDRRDAAIDASRCKAQIKEWVSHPENLPVPFDPFNQLGH